MITVNCIGAGRWGPNIVRALTNLPDAQIHLVCDLDTARLDLIRQRMPGVETTTDVNRALADPTADAVVIATPVETHFALTTRALEAGKHVLVEKPLCDSVANCESLLEKADTFDRVLAVGHVFLFNGGIRKIREYIDSGELGRIYYIHATRTNLGPVRNDVNALWDLAAHDLSIFDYWLGHTPERVSVNGQRFISKNVDDVVTASFTYPGGQLAIAYASWLNPRKVREITVVGEKKMAVWDDMDLIEPVRIYNKSIDVGESCKYADSFASFRAMIRDGDVIIPRVDSCESLVAECAHFIDCIKSGRTPVNNAQGGMEVVRSLEAADRSMACGGQSVAVVEPAARQTHRLSTELEWAGAPA